MLEDLDLVRAARPPALRAILTLVPPSQLILGSDVRYCTAREHVEGLASSELFEDLRAIGRENALRPLPRVAESTP